MLSTPKPDPIRVHFFARQLAYYAKTGDEWFTNFVPLSLDPESPWWDRHSPYPTSPALQLQERWLVRAVALRWPLARMADFKASRLLWWFRKLPEREQEEVCTVLENYYEWYA